MGSSVNNLFTLANKVLFCGCSFSLLLSILINRRQESKNSFYTNKTNVLQRHMGVSKEYRNEIIKGVIDQLKKLGLSEKTIGFFMRAYHVNVPIYFFIIMIFNQNFYFRNPNFIQFIFILFNLLFFFNLNYFINLMSFKKVKI